MGKIMEPMIQLTERDTATSSSFLRRLYNSLSVGCDESTGLGTLVFADATVDVVIDMGTIAIGRFLCISSDQDISLKLNGSVTATPLGTFFLIVADATTGITGVTLSNASGSSATVERWIAGDTTV